jgi:hypothetical protein
LHGITRPAQRQHVHQRNGQQQCRRVRGPNRQHGVGSLCGKRGGGGRHRMHLS